MIIGFDAAHIMRGRSIQGLHEQVQRVPKLKCRGRHVVLYKMVIAHELKFRVKERHPNPVKMLQQYTRLPERKCN